MLCVVGEFLDADELVEQRVVVRDDMRLVESLARELEHCAGELAHSPFSIY